MKRLFALACIGWIACSANSSNVAPLAFGMSPEDAATALGKPLTLVSGDRGAAIFLAAGDANQPGFYPMRERIYLQFRRGALTGWKYDWHVPRPWF